MNNIFSKFVRRQPENPPVENVVRKHAPAARAVTSGSAHLVAAPNPAGTAGPVDAENYDPELQRTHPDLKMTSTKPAETRRRFEEYRGLTIPNSVVRAVARMGNVTLTTEEIEALESIQKRYDEAHSVVMAHTETAARQAMKAQHERISDQIRSGLITAIGASDAWSRADFVEDFAVKRRMAKLECRSIAESSAPVIRAVLERIGNVAAAIADGMEREERAKAEQFGLDHVPSRATVLIGQLSWRWPELVESHTSSPRECLKWLTP